VSEAKQKRPRFRMHLSTAIIMMLVASALVWANFWPRTEGTSSTFISASLLSDAFGLSAPKAFGWPFDFCVASEALAISGVELKYLWLETVSNFLIAYSILISVSFLSEWFIRWWSRTKQASQLSLATCILLIMVAGLLLWMNVKPTWSGPLREGELILGGFYSQGWPFTFRTYYPGGSGNVDTMHCLGSLFISGSVLICAGFISEWLIRRRVATKQEPQI